MSTFGRRLEHNQTQFLLPVKFQMFCQNKKKCSGQEKHQSAAKFRLQSKKNTFKKRGTKCCHLISLRICKKKYFKNVFLLLFFCANENM
jgi:hypothetical protein